MILKCLDGPMSGAVYTLSRQHGEPSTNRKPDGLWFDRQEDSGQWVQDQYGFDRLAEGGDHVTMVYRFGGSIPLLVAGTQSSDEVPSLAMPHELGELKELSAQCDGLDEADAHKLFSEVDRLQLRLDLNQEAMREARAALYGCREVLGSVANIQHAIDLLNKATSGLNYVKSPGFESRELTPAEHTEERIKNETEGAVDAYDE